MPAVLKSVAYKSKANVTADCKNIKYYFQAPQDQNPTGSSHWGFTPPVSLPAGRRAWLRSGPSRRTPSATQTPVLACIVEPTHSVPCASREICAHWLSLAAYSGQNNLANHSQNQRRLMKKQQSMVYSLSEVAQPAV